MDVKELQKKKGELNQNILDLIKQFENECEVYIESIHYSVCEKMLDYGNQRSVPIVTNLEIDINI